MTKVTSKNPIKAGGGAKKPTKQDLYQKFISFIAMPDFERAEMLEIKVDPETKKFEKAPTQKAFALKFGIHQDTCVDWKKVEGFWQAVDAKQKEWGADLVPNVLAALYRRCVKYGIAYDVETFLAYYTGWNRTVKLETGQTRFAMDDLRALMAHLPKEQQEKIYDTINNALTSRGGEKKVEPSSNAGLEDDSN